MPRTVVYDLDSAYIVRAEILGINYFYSFRIGTFSLEFS